MVLFDYVVYQESGIPGTRPRSVFIHSIIQSLHKRDHHHRPDHHDAYADVTAVDNPHDSDEADNNNNDDVLRH